MPINQIYLDEERDKKLKEFCSSVNRSKADILNIIISKKIDELYIELKKKNEKRDMND